MSLFTRRRLVLTFVFLGVAVFAGVNFDASRAAKSKTKPSALVPSVSATMTAAPTTDVGGNGAFVNPGDTVRYTATINNTGADPATGVVFTDNLTDPSLTLVPGSIRATPIAGDDIYAVTGNVRIQKPAGTLFSNDVSPTNKTFTITQLGNATSAPFVSPTTSGGTVRAATGDGSFEYNPPAGFEGSGASGDTFTYIITDSDGLTGTGTVRLDVSGMIWFIDSTAPLCFDRALGCGRLTSPYSSLAAFQAQNNGTGNNPAVNDNVFVYTGGGTYAGGVTLLNGQKLIGQGATSSLVTIAGITLAPDSDPLPNTGGARPVITNSGGNGVTLGSGNTLNGFNVGDTSGVDVTGANFGTLTVAAVALNGTGRPLGLGTGILAATFDGVASTSSLAGPGVALNAVSGSMSVFGGTSVAGGAGAIQCVLVQNSTANVDFGNTTCTGGTDGIFLQNNTAGTRTFGTVTVSGGTAPAFVHNTAGGDVTVTGAANLTSPVTAISVNAPGSTNFINFQSTTNATTSGAGNTAVNWVGTAGATLAFNNLTIQRNNATALNATTGGTINVNNSVGSITNTTSGGPAIVANGVTLNVQFANINSTASTNAISLTNCAGSSSFGTGTLSGSTGNTINVVGGTANFGYTGNLTHTTAGFAAISVSGGHNGTVIYSTGTISATNGNGLQFDNADGTYQFNSGTITLNGGDAAIDIINGSGSTFVFGTGTTITNPTGTAFNVNGSSPSLTYSGSISKNNAGELVNVTNQIGGSITFQTGTLSATGGTGISLNNADSTVQFTGTTILNGGDAGVDISNGSSGSFNFFSGTTITNPSGVAYSEDLSPATVSFDGTIVKSNGSQTAVDINGKTNGDTRFNGSVTASTGTANAIDLTNSGGLVAFRGGLSATTTSGVAFNAVGSGGTIIVCDENDCLPAATGALVNTLTSTTGTALNVANTTIGANNLEFRGISSNGAPSGIILNTTGSSGGLAVKGNSSGICGGSVGAGPPATAAAVTAPVVADCTGGTIQNSTGPGIVLTNTNNVSLTRMRVINGGNDGVQGTNVTGFTLASSFFDENGDDIHESGVDFGETSGTTPNGLHGTCSVTNSTIRYSYYNGFSVRNFNGPALTSCNITGSQFRANPADPSPNDSVFFEASGTNSIATTITGNHFSSQEGDHIQTNGVNSGSLNVGITNNTFTGGHLTPLGQGITIAAATGVPGWNGRIDYDVNGNNIQSAASNGVSVVLGTSAAAGVFDGFVRNNVIGTSGVALSCSSQANGVYIDARGNGTHNSSVTGNTIRRCFDRGILTEAGDGDSVLNLTVQSNIIDQQVDDPVNTREAIQTNFGITSTNVFGNIDTNNVCLQLGGAGALANTFSHGGGAPDDFRLRKRFEATVRLPGYAGGAGQGAGDLAAVVAFIQGQNTGSAGEPGSASASGTGGGYTGGAACTLPTLAKPADEFGSTFGESRTTFGESQRTFDELLTAFDESGSTFGDLPSVFIRSTGDALASESVIRETEWNSHAFGDVVNGEPLAVNSEQPSETLSLGFEVLAKITEMISPAVHSQELKESAQLGGTILVNGAGAGFTIPPGKSTTITFDATIAPVGTISPTAFSVSNQGQVSGSNFVMLNTDGDAGTAGAQPTVTTVVQPEIIQIAFNPTSTFNGGTSTLTYTINNNDPSTPANAMTFQHTLPTAGGFTLRVASPSALTNTCGGTVTRIDNQPVDNGTSVKLTGGALAANSTCTISLKVTYSGPGARTYTVTTGPVTSTEGATGLQSNSAQVAFSALTAAGVTVSGRVISAEGRGVTNARVSITDSQGTERTLITGRSGRFSFEDVEAGRTYVISVASRRFRFTPRVLMVTDNVSDVDFVAEE